MIDELRDVIQCYKCIFFEDKASECRREPTFLVKNPDDWCGRFVGQEDGMVYWAYIPPVEGSELDQY